MQTSRQAKATRHTLAQDMYSTSSDISPGRLFVGSSQLNVKEADQWSSALISISTGCTSVALHMHMHTQHNTE